MAVVSFILFLFASSVSASDNLSGVDSVGRILTDNSNKTWKTNVCYTTDGNSNVIPISSSGGGSGGTVQQGSQSGSASPWQFDLEQILGATPSASNYVPSRITNGSSFIDPTDTRLLTSSDVVTVLQGTSPWIVDGSGSIQPVSQSGTWTVQQGTPPWSVSQSGVWTTGRTWTLLNSTDSVNSWSLDGSGNALSSQVSGTQQALDIGIDVAGVQVDPRNIRALSSGTDSVTANQGGTWNINNVSGTVTLPTGAATSANQTTGNTSLASIDSKLTSPIAVSQSGTWTVQQGSPPWSVSQSGVWTTGRTWSLSNGSDSVSVVQSTSPWISNVSQFGGSNVVTGTGISGAGIPRVTVASDSSITANAGTNLNTSALALSVNQTNGTQKTQVVDGSGNVQPSGDTIARSIFVFSSPLDGSKQSYSSSSGNTFTVAVPAPTDVCVVGGSATKTIRITRLSFACSQNTAGLRVVNLIKRSTADTGGGSNVNTITPHDSTNSAATGTFTHYTITSPTLGSSVGTIRSYYFEIPSASVTTEGKGGIDTFFGDKEDQAIVLRGTAQQLAINFNGATIAGLICSCWAGWTEE